MFSFSYYTTFILPMKRYFYFSNFYSKYNFETHFIWYLVSMSSKVIIFNLKSQILTLIFNEFGLLYQWKKEQNYQAYLSLLLYSFSHLLFVRVYYQRYSWWQFSQLKSLFSLLIPLRLQTCLYIHFYDKNTNIFSFCFSLQ